MRKSINLLFLSVMMTTIVFSGCSKDDDPEPEQVSTSAEFDVKYKTELLNTVYPSLIYGFSEMEALTGESSDYFTITVNPSKEMDIRIVIEPTKLNDETIITQKISTKTDIIPNIKWKYDDLKNLSQSGTIDMTFVCYNGSTELARKTQKLSYKSINECILYMDDNGKQNNLTPLLAAYVNENSPVIDVFMKEVLDADTLINTFSGYQNGPDEVINQADAIFTQLRKKGIKYSDIASGNRTVTKYLSSQHIRFADEVLTNTQANCADGTVFFCSVLQKIGIRSFMVFEPGHVYLGFYLDNDKSQMSLLETTTVGNKEYSFQDALNLRVSNFTINRDKYLNDNVLDLYFTVDIPEARKLIKPIGR